MVRKKRLEPSRYYYRQPLKLAAFLKLPDEHWSNRVQGR